MPDNTTDRRQDPAAIERDVRRTQDDIGETVQKLEDKMNPRDIARSVLGEDGSKTAGEVLEVTRQNPVPVALIAIGLIWLLSTSRSPMIRRFTDRLSGKGAGTDKSSDEFDLRPRSPGSAPIGPRPPSTDSFDRRPPKTAGF